MKKLEFIIKSENLEDLKTMLLEFNVNDIMISNIRNFNSEKGYKKICRGAEYTANLLRRLWIEAVVAPETAELIIDKVLQKIKTGNYEDGKIFISNIENAVEICAV